MSRIPVPASVEAAVAESRALLEGVKAQLGSVPNLFRLVSTSPAALEGYLALSAALAKGRLPAKTRERVALAVATLNGCDHCDAAHGYLAKHVAKLDDAEIEANRTGRSGDPLADAALRFVTALVRERGHVSDETMRGLRDAGYDDAQIVEIVLHVALNTWTNYVNSVADTPIDFPSARKSKAA